MLRAVGGFFVAGAAASAVALTIIGGNDLDDAVRIGFWVDHAVTILLPLAVLAIAVRAAPRSRLRTIAFVTGGTWLFALAGRLPAALAIDTYAVSACVSVVRTVAVALLALLPVLAAERRVVPRWPLFATIALAAGDGARKIGMARYGVLPAQFDPSPSTMVLCALLAYAFFTSARELADESIDERADRFAPISTTLFPAAADRAAFLGPIRLATDAVLAFAIATSVATTTTVAYSRSFRLDAPAAGPETSALIIVATGALIWFKRSWNGVSFAPIIAAVVASMAASFSTMFANGAALSLALLPFALAVVGLGVVAPRTRDTDARTMRRWVTFISATGVMLGSAGFFSIYSFGSGEPFLARVSKLGAVVFGVLAANAAARLEGHARVELAVEHRES